MKQEKEKEIVSKVLSDLRNGNKTSVFYVVTRNITVDMTSFETEVSEDIYISKEEALEAKKEYLKTFEPQFGFVHEIIVEESVIDERDLLSVTGFDSVSEIEDDDICITDIMEASNENDHTWFDAEKEPTEIVYDYKSVKGAVIVEWCWLTYVGYARKFMGLRFGYDDETEITTLKGDKTFKRECDILMSKEEWDEMSESFRRDALTQILLEKSHWKWRNEGKIVDAIEELIEKDNN